MELTEKALRLATTAHKEQVRKTDNSPYVVHVLMVGMLLKEHGFSEEVVAAGFTHDVIEDTAVTEEELRAALGDEVGDYVVAVSEDTDLPWKERKELYVEAVVAASEGAKAVCIADKIHNAESLLDHYEQMGTKVWDVFSKGKADKLWFEELVYAKVSATWRHSLLERYRDCIDRLQQLDA